MSKRSDLHYKIASEGWEFEAIHRLNYKTFVDEIPQHPPNPDRRLVDRFHAENVYCICVEAERLLAMVCLRTTRPFSLDQKLDNLQQYLPQGKSICEIRLLAVEPEVRHGRVTIGLFQFLARHALAHGFDLGIMSGTTRQLKLYRRVGFVPFGPLVGQGEALYQPMLLSLATFVNATLPRLNMAAPTKAAEAEPVVANFLPGPVAVSAAVRAAMATMPQSHRSLGFLDSLRTVKHALLEMTGARYVDVLLGSGTLANDMVAAQLKLTGMPGLILSNGEFGERLVDHAARQPLSFDCVRADWGSALVLRDIKRVLDRLPSHAWCWMTYCETSTGMVNDVPGVAALCRARGIHLCLDAISAIGVKPVNFEETFFATAVSGKGLQGAPGLSMVFHNHPVAASASLPRYLDLGLHAASGDGVPFTHSSNLIDALRVALTETPWPVKFTDVARDGLDLRERLRAQLAPLGCQLIADQHHVSPAITTVALPSRTSARKVGEALEQAGFLLSYRSAFLLERNWIQLCLMGVYSAAHCAAVVAALAIAVARFGRSD